VEETVPLFTVPHKVASTHHQGRHIRAPVVTQEAQELPHTIVPLPHFARANQPHTLALQANALMMSRLTRVAQIRLLAQRRPMLVKSRLQGQLRPMADLNPSQERPRHMVVLSNQSLEHLHPMVVLRWNQSLEQPLHMGMSLSVLVLRLQFLPREDRLCVPPLLSLEHLPHTLASILLDMCWKDSHFPVLVRHHQCQALPASHSRHPLVCPALPQVQTTHSLARRRPSRALLMQLSRTHHSTL